MSASFCFSAALFSVVFFEIAIIGVTGSPGPYDPGAAGIVAIGLLTLLWLQPPSIKFGQLLLYVVIAAISLASVLLSGIGPLWGRILAAGLGGGGALLLYSALSRFVTGGPERVGLAFAGVLTFAVGVGNAPLAFRNAGGAIWPIGGLAVATIALLAVVTADGLGGSRGRLRQPGLILLTVACIFGLLALVY